MEQRDLALTSKVLILGSSGLIGHQVYNYLEAFSNYQLSNLAYKRKFNKSTIQVDALDEDTFYKAIEDISPDYIVNCIGILIDAADIDLERTIFLNAIMPYRLMKLADRINCKLIHMSSDCVFSGYKGSSYIETDQKDGRDTYAKTKGLGEIISENHLTLRTSVVGPELNENGTELFNWFMNQSGSIEGYSNV
ncbi:sugar nucleotide-binding protein, partial [Candidatus Thioglobus sp.]|nr:sugar nucleotide-binding protein [Candidatus Thioglobus sp.]